MANPISNWLYTGAAPGTQAATKTLAQTTPWGEVGKQVLAEGGYGFGSNNKGFDPKYTGKGATKNPLKYTYEGAKSFGAKVPGNIGGGTPAGRLAFEKLLQSPLAKGVGAVGRLATGPIGWGATAGITGAQIGDWAYKNWKPATEFGDWAGGGIYDLIYGPQNKFRQDQFMNTQKQKIQEVIRQAEIEQKRKEAAAATAAANAAAAGQRRAGRGGSHMSRSRDQGGLGISRSQAQSISDANRAAGMSGWGLAEGGLINLYRYGGFI